MESAKLRKHVSATTLLDPSIVLPAIGQAFVKLDPRTLAKNPVMFVLEVVTLLTTVLATGLGLVFAVLSAIFIVEFAPEWIRRLIVPIVPLLAAVPSVVHGLIGILVLPAFVAS